MPREEADVARLGNLKMGVSTTASVETETTGTKRHDLQQAAGHGNVLEEVDELVLIAQLMI